MIRARATTTAGRPVIIIGLEEGNITRLREDKPIHIHADELGFAGEIVIILGKDAATLTMLLKQAGLVDERTAQIDRRNERPS